MSIKSRVCTIVGTSLLLSIASPAEEQKPWAKPLNNIASLIEKQPHDEEQKQAEISATLQTLQSVLATENLNQAVQELNRLRTLKPEAIKPILELSGMLLEELRGKSQAEIARVDKLHQEFAKAIFTMEKPSEIDAWLKTFNNEVKNNSKRQYWQTPISAWAPVHGGDPFASEYHAFNARTKDLCSSFSQITTLSQGSRAALDIARYWQDYLQYKSEGNISYTKNSLDRVANYVVNFTLIPRSKILTLRAKYDTSSGVKPTPSTPTIFTLETLAEQSDSTEKFYAFCAAIESASSSRLSPEITSIKYMLRDVKRGIDEFSRGDLRDGYTYLNAAAKHPLLGDICNRILDQKLSEHLPIPESYVRKKSETPVQWVVRYYKELAAQKDWLALRPVLNGAHLCWRNSGVPESNFIRDDLEATVYLLRGLQFEENQLYPHAMVAYRRVFERLGYLSEVQKEASSRLKGLKKSHPKAYIQSLNMEDTDSAIEATLLLK
jgi:hypothetical protein